MKMGKYGTQEYGICWVCTNPSDGAMKICSQCGHCDKHCKSDGCMIVED